MIRVSEVGRRSPPRMRPRTAAKKPSPTSGAAPTRPATAKQRKGMPLGESVSVAVLEALAAQETHMRLVVEVDRALARRLPQQVAL